MKKNEMKKRQRLFFILPVIESLVTKDFSEFFF